MDKLFPDPRHEAHFDPRGHRRRHHPLDVFKPIEPLPPTKAHSEEERTSLVLESSLHSKPVTAA
jgi:hypothetical protein